MPNQRKNSITIPKNYLIVGGIVVILAIGMYFLGSSQLSGKIVDVPNINKNKQSCPHECCINDPNYENRVCQGNNYQCIDNKCVKSNCPYECCLEGQYSIKLCQEDYECKNNQCIPLDSDKDGLTDIEEKQVGTNPNLVDTDGDTLSDYQEVKVLKTNPLNVNTDGDRYNDNLDRDPLIVNSANVVFSKSNERGEYNYLNMIKDGATVATVSAGLGVCTVGTMGACALAIPPVAAVLNPILNDVLYTSSIDITFRNIGSDYTSFINYDIVYSIGSTRLQSISNNAGRLDPGGSITIPFAYDIKLKDIQYGSTWDLILGKNKIDINIENVNYEKF